MSLFTPHEKPLAQQLVHPRDAAPVFLHLLANQPTKDDALVGFDGGDDHYRLMNWSLPKKVLTTLLYGFTTCWITFASAIYSTAVRQVSRNFRVSWEVSTLGTSLFVICFALGPLIFAPLSEVYGRKPAVLTPYFVAAIFPFATRAAKDTQTVVTTRFFAGFFGSAPVTTTGGMLGNIWSAEQRGLAIGPTIGPLVGGAFVASGPGWRWTGYLTGIVMMLQLILDVCILDESYASTLLARKAQLLRYKGGNWALHAMSSHVLVLSEEWDVSLKELSQKYLIRPFQMLLTPICFLVSLYASFVYGLLYANLGGFTIVFEENRGWSPVTANLPFLALLVGILAAAVVNVYNNKYYFRLFTENGNRAVQEARLPPMMIGGFMFSGGLFFFEWTSSRMASYWPFIVDIALVGFGFTTIPQAAMDYIVDTLSGTLPVPVAAATFLRSIFACAFPLFVGPFTAPSG
ncbi:MFS multidrug transporter [Aspergillus sp. HF37]|nr:MFS multidrug transporter [Aspergillus sp. HF37]